MEASDRSSHTPVSPNGFADGRRKRALPSERHEHVHRQDESGPPKISIGPFEPPQPHGPRDRQGRLSILPPGQIFVFREKSNRNRGRLVARAGGGFAQQRRPSLPPSTGMGVDNISDAWSAIHMSRQRHIAAMSNKRTGALCERRNPFTNTGRTAAPKPTPLEIPPHPLPPPLTHREGDVITELLQLLPQRPRVRSSTVTAGALFRESCM